MGNGIRGKKMKCNYILSSSSIRLCIIASFHLIMNLTSFILSVKKKDTHESLRLSQTYPLLFPLPLAQQMYFLFL